MFQRKSDGLWVEEVTVNGKKKRITAKTKAALKQKLTGAAVVREHGFTFKEVSEAWEKAHSSQIESTTAGSYAPQIKRMQDFFGEQRINDITPSQAQAFVDSLVQKGFKRDTVHRGKSILNAIFNFAITMEGSTIRYNPCAAVKMPRGLEHTRREPPTSDQILKVNADSEMGRFAIFLLYTGLRRGELLALQWSDINFEARTITVNKAMQYDTNAGHIKAGAKTEAGNRTVPLLDALAEILPRDRSGFVFGGDKPLTNTMIHKRWLAWCREVGLAEETKIEFTGKNGHKYTKSTWRPLVTPHQFRHQYATMLWKAKVDELDTKSVMGHSSITITRDIYQHIAAHEKQSEVADKLNEYIKSTVH